MKRRRPDIRATMYANAIIDAEISPATADRIIETQEHRHERIEAKWCREYSFAIQGLIRDREIRRCYFEDCKRGERGGGGSNSDKKRTEALKRKITKYAIANRSFYPT